LEKLVDFILGTNLFIFDLDGTLVDSEEQIFDALSETLRESGHSPIVREMISSNIGIPIDQILKKIGIETSDHKSIIVRFREILSTKIERNVSLYLGVEDLIGTLIKNDKKIAIATSKPANLARKTIAHSKLSRFNIHIQGTDGFPPKPSPDILFRVMENLNEKSAIMIGDRTEDIMSALAAGIPSIGVAQSAHSEIELLECGAVAAYSTISEVALGIKNLLV